MFGFILLIAAGAGLLYYKAKKDQASAGEPSSPPADPAVSADEAPSRPIAPLGQAPASIPVPAGRDKAAAALAGAPAVQVEAPVSPPATKAAGPELQTQAAFSDLAGRNTAAISSPTAPATVLGVREILTGIKDVSGDGFARELSAPEALQKAVSSPVPDIAPPEDLGASFLVPVYPGQA